MSETKHSTRVTLSQIAKRVGLSSAAVSMALRGHQRISAATRQRVLEEATRLGYVYDRGAAKLRTGQSDTVGIIISDIANGFFGELVAGVDEVIAETGMISFLFNTRDDVRRQESLLIRLREQGVDGMILCPAPGTDPALLERISAWGIPTVQMLRCISADQADYVSADYRTGVEALCEHLLAIGHRRIAFLGGCHDHSATSQRLAGFHGALQRHGLAPAGIIRCPATRQAGRESIKTLLATPQPATAAICYNDLIAFGVLAGLRDAGLVPGQDFAVTGFDDVEEAAASWPPLTTAATHPRDIGQAAGRLLLRRIATPGAAPERLIIPTEIIVRSSCGAKTGG